MDNNKTDNGRTDLETMGRKHTGDRRTNGKWLLLIILTVFCILAVAEILHGRGHATTDDPQADMEANNRKAAEKAEKELGGLQDGTDAAAGEQEADTAAAEQTPEDKPSMQIVFMGDSILDNEEEGCSVAEMVGEKCNAKVYNMAVAGSMAALLPNEYFDFTAWRSNGFLGVVQGILGNISADFFSAYDAGAILNECDFSQTDYFVVEYGINDFLSGQVPQSKYLEGGAELDIDEPHTYAGALDVGVRTLLQHFPNAKILMVSPHFCQIYDGDVLKGDSYTLDYGYGTLVDFCGCCTYVANQHKNEGVLYFNAMDDSGIDAYTVKEYLKDGVHLSGEGIRLYADIISEMIDQDYYRAE